MKPIAFGLALVGLANAGRLDHYARINPNLDIVWHKCPKGTDKEYDCGTFEVPLDWHDHSKGAAKLAIARLNATVTPKLGILFTNPGGPGNSGVDDVLGSAKVLSADYLGDAYDIVSWDPRGVGITTPRIDCFNDTSTAEKFWKSSKIHDGIETHGDFTNKDETDPDVVAFWKEEPKMDKLLGKFGQQCLEQNGENLKYVGTAAGVRDLVHLSAALQGHDELINFWGFSYGTVMAAYLVNMFPNKVGRVIADGVVNPYVWATEPAHHVWAHCILDVDGTFAGFAGSCAMAGPSGCAIAWKGATQTQLVKWTRDLMDAAYDYNKKGGEISSGSIRNEIFGAMYNPSSWVGLAESLYEYAGEIYNGTTSEKHRRKRASDESTYDTAFHAITCADAIDTGNVTTKDIFQSIVETSRDISQMFGPAIDDAGFFCHKWPARAVERFTGPFNHTLKTPILVIGNEYDPITPYAGAKALADGLGDSAILMKQDDYGHCSLAQHSDCTISIINAFFANGTYPIEDQFCPTNQNLFPAQSVTKEKLFSAVGAAAQGDFHTVPGSPAVVPSADAHELQDQVKSLRNLKRTLFIALGALGLALLLALAALAFTIVKSRSQKPTKYKSVVLADQMRESAAARGSMDTVKGSYADGGKGYSGQH